MKFSKFFAKLFPKKKDPSQLDTQNESPQPPQSAPISAASSDKNTSGMEGSRPILSNHTNAATSESDTTVNQFQRVLPMVIGSALSVDTSATFHDADDGNPYVQRQGVPTWNPVNPGKSTYIHPDIIEDIKNSSPISLELWPVSKVATEFANNGILSHVWGNDLKVTDIEGVPVLLRQDDPTKINLVREILKTGANGQCRVWADVLDINQKDDKVKVAQIEQLPELYKTKTFTIIYHSESPESLCQAFDEKTKYSVTIDTLRRMLENSEHSSRVWTLQEIALANRMVHVFRTSDPTSVLVTHEAFKSDWLKAADGGWTLRMHYSQIMKPWFFRRGDFNQDLDETTLTLLGADASSITDSLPQSRQASRVQDYVNGRAAIYNIKPLPYDATIQEIFNTLIQMEPLYLYGDFPIDSMGRSVFPKDPYEFGKLFSRMNKQVSVPTIQYKTVDGTPKNLRLTTIRCPVLSEDKSRLDWTYTNTENDEWAMKVTAKIIRTDESLLKSLHLGTARVDWWKPENQEDRIFVYEKQLCGFNSDGSLQYFDWAKSPFNIPFVARVAKTIYLIKSMTENEVVLGRPAGILFNDVAVECEKDVLIHFFE